MSGQKQPPEKYACENCKDKGTVNIGFLWLTKIFCPVCKGDPIAHFNQLNSPGNPPVK